jgi:hypothetical protein
LNNSTQGSDMAVNGLIKCSKLFKEKLKFGKKQMEIHKIAPCPTFNVLLKEENPELLEVKNVDVEHLEDLKINFERYILESVVKYMWAPNQFDIDIKVFANDIQALLAFMKCSSRTKIISHCSTNFQTHSLCSG